MGAGKGDHRLGYRGNRVCGYCSSSSSNTLRPRCGRRETTATHISAVGASPGKEADLAVAGQPGAHRISREAGGGRWGWGVGGSGQERAANPSTESLHGGAGYIIFRELVQNY